METTLPTAATLVSKLSPRRAVALDLALEHGASEPSVTQDGRGGARLSVYLGDVAGMETWEAADMMRAAGWEIFYRTARVTFTAAVLARHTASR